MGGVTEIPCGDVCCMCYHTSQCQYTGFQDECESSFLSFFSGEIASFWWISHNWKLFFLFFLLWYSLILSVSTQDNHIWKMHLLAFPKAFNYILWSSSTDGVFLIKRLQKKEEREFSFLFFFMDKTTRQNFIYFENLAKCLKLSTASFGLLQLMKFAPEQASKRTLSYDFVAKIETIVRHVNIITVSSSFPGIDPCCTL